MPPRTARLPRLPVIYYKPLTEKERDDTILELEKVVDGDQAPTDVLMNPLPTVMDAFVKGLITPDIESTATKIAFVRATAVFGGRHGTVGVRAAVKVRGTRMQELKMLSDFYHKKYSAGTAHLASKSEYYLDRNGGIQLLSQAIRNGDIEIVSESMRISKGPEGKIAHYYILGNLIGSLPESASAADIIPISSRSLDILEGILKETIGDTTGRWRRDRMLSRWIESVLHPGPLERIRQPLSLIIWPIALCASACSI